MIDIISISIMFITLIIVIDINLVIRKKQSSLLRNTIIVDTSTLIDGRIVDLVNSGFVHEQIIIPSFILDELQLLADGKDQFKRDRARVGLDSVNKIKAELSTARIGLDKDTRALKTDEKIVQFALKNKSIIHTIDSNLQKVAQAQGITVVNINELALLLRQNILPGDIVKVKILQKGETNSQGVGYLDDGTLVVVENASHLKNKVVEAKATRLINTKSGKMLFTQLQIK